MRWDAKTSLVFSSATSVYLARSLFPRYELGRQPANTKLSSNVTVRRVRVRGGNYKFRALRLDSGNFAWGSEVFITSAIGYWTHKCQIWKGISYGAWENCIHFSVIINT